MLARPGKVPRSFGVPTPILWIFLLALAIRVLVVLRSDPVAFDSGIYFEMAQYIRAGNWAAALAYDFPPLYPVLIAGMQFLGISAAAAGLSIALAADLLVLFPLAGIARAAAGEAAAWGAALLWAIHPYAVRLGVQALTDGPTALFIALAVWAGIRALGGGHPPSAIRHPPETGRHEASVTSPRVPMGRWPTRLPLMSPLPSGGEGHGEGVATALPNPPSPAPSPSQEGEGGTCEQQPVQSARPPSAIRCPPEGDRKVLAGGDMLWAVGAGAASGLAYLLRPEGIEPALVLAAFYAVESRKAKGQSPAPGRGTWRRAAWAVMPLAGWGIVASPYVAAISLEAGSLSLSKKKSAVAFLRAVGPGLTPQPANPLPQAPTPAPPLAGGETVAGGRGAGSGYARAGAGQEPPPTAKSSSPVREKEESWARRRAGALYRFQRGLVNGIHPFVLVFGVIGAISLRRAGEGSEAPARRLLLALLGLHLAVLFGLAAARGADYVGGHHFFPMVVYALPYAGAGLATATRWGAQRLRAPRLGPACAIALLVAAAASQSIFRRPGRGAALRPAAEWIRAQAPGTPVVVTDMAKFTYHAGAQRLELLGGYDAVLRRARAQGAQFVAFYPDMLRQRSPDFLARLGGGDLEFARAFPEPSASDPSRRFEIYRLKTR